MTGEGVLGPSGAVPASGGLVPVSAGAAAAPGASSRSVVVVGAGISGLVVAYRLAASGHAVVLVDAAPVPGGRIGTVERDGFVLEAGPDALVASSAVLALCRELGLDGDLVEPLPPATTSILWRGRLHPLPPGSAAGIPVRLRAYWPTRLLRPWEKARVLVDLVLPGEVSLDPDGPLGVPLRRRLGRAVVERLVEPLLGGLHGGSLDELSAGAVAPWLVEVLRRGSVLRALRGRVASSGPIPLRSFRRGTGQLVAALVARLEGRATWILGQPVVSLVRAPRGWALTFAPGPSPASGPSLAPDPTLADHPALAADAVVLACPAPTAANLLRSIDPILAEALAGIPYGSTAVVNLAYREGDLGRPAEGHGFLVPRVEPSLLRGASWSSRKWPGRAPPEVLLVRAFLGGDDWPGRSDGELIERAIAGLEPVLAPRREPILAEVHRFEGAMPRYGVGHLARVRVIEERAALHPGLFLVGSAYRGAGIAELVAAAEGVARAVTAEAGARPEGNPSRALPSERVARALAPAEEKAGMAPPAETVARVAGAREGAGTCRLASGTERVGRAAWSGGSRGRGTAASRYGTGGGGRSAVRRHRLPQRRAVVYPVGVPTPQPPGPLRRPARRPPKAFRPRVVVIGDLVLDAVLVPSRPLERGTDVPGRVALRQGGSAANTARWLARLGARTTLVAAVGRDRIGRALVEAVRVEGVTPRVTRIAGLRSGRIGVLVSPDGERSFVADRGAADQLAPEHLRAAWFKDIDLLHLPAYSLLGEPLGLAGRAAIEQARGNGALVSLDLASIAPLLARGRRAARSLVTWVRADILFATEAETEALLGRYAVDDLLDFAPLAIVKRGAKGATVLVRTSAAGSERLKFEVATRPVTTDDSTGAGDAFDAGFLVAWLAARASGRPLVSGLRRAALAGHRTAIRHLTTARPELVLG